MHRARIVPVLLLKGHGLVKSQKFTDYGYIGDPMNAIRIFNEKETDELVLLDIMASKEGRGPDMEYIEKLAEECFMPLAYGGGITTIDHMHELFRLGIEKVILNSAALEDLNIVSEAASLFGRQSVVVSIDYKSALIGGKKIYSHAKKKSAFKNPAEFAKAAEAAGCGEIMLHHVDRDGTQKGFDIDFCRQIAKTVAVPVIACGGGGTLDHFRSALLDGEASAAAGGSFFVYRGKHKAVLITYPKPDEIEAIYEHAETNKSGTG